MMIQKFVSKKMDVHFSLIKSGKTGVLEQLLKKWIACSRQLKAQGKERENKVYVDIFQKTRNLHQGGINSSVVVFLLLLLFLLLY